MWHVSLQAVTNDRRVITGCYLDRRRQPFTILYMSDIRSPARPWFDLVTREIAVRGWGITELARRAKVGRPTVYGWRDSAGKPQSGPVNAVADVLGIDRKRANELAGIIPRDGPERGPAPDLARDEPGLYEALFRAYDGDRERTLAALRAVLDAEAEASGPGAGAHPPSSRRRAG